MHTIASIAVLAVSAAAAMAQGNDARRCLELVAAERFDAARPVCRNLELADPEAALAFGYFELYGEVGRKRLPAIAHRGIDAATPREKRSLESAMIELRVAAEAGLPDAQMLLALTIGLFRPAEFDADGVQYDEEQTVWLQKAAEQGVAEANYQLGARALSPFGTLLVRPEYLPYLERAAELGHEQAASQLDDYRAAADFAATGRLDNPEALRNHATELWSSRSGDVREANRLMRLLADAGDEEAMFFAGRWAWPDDADAARKYLGMAAGTGNAKATMALGNWFACSGDAAEARRWFEKALSESDPEARVALDELAEWGVEGWDCRFL